MKRMFPEVLHRPRVAWIAFAALLLVFALSAAGPVSAQTPLKWTTDNARQAFDGYNNYFYWGPQIFTPTPSWSLPEGNGQTYSIYRAKNPGQNVWNQFWFEAEEIELAEDAYEWAVRHGVDTQPYIDRINALCQGFIVKMSPQSNFGDGVPWVTGGNPYNWHGPDYKAIDYNPGTVKGNWFNDDRMWAAMAFARAYQITGRPGWLAAAKEQVDWVWANAQAQTNDPTNGINGTKVGFLQAFCNKNKNGTCNNQSPDGKWNPNLDAEVNFPFVIAADILANNTTGGDRAKYQNMRNAVYAWAMENLYTEATAKATACTTKFNIPCAEIYDSNGLGPFNGEYGWWSKYVISGIKRSTTDYTMNYGVAIQAAVRMGDYEKAQNLANYLIYGLNDNQIGFDNPANRSAGSIDFNGKTYRIMPIWWPKTGGVVTGYGEGGNFDGSNGIAFRGIGYALYRGALNDETKYWAQANVQAGWNTRNSDNVMWDNWEPGDVTGTKPYFGRDYVYNSWDCSSAVVGLLTIPEPKYKPGFDDVDPVTVAPSTNPSDYNRSITFTATVPASPMAATGTITFADNGAPFGDPVTISGNTATYTTSTLSVGTHQITAVYSGDDHYIGVTSEPLIQTVNKAPTTVALLSSQTPSIYGYAVTYTATVAPSTVGGTVNFLDGDVELCSGVTVANGVATCTTSTMTTGSHSITAFYSGDSNYLASASSTISQVVNPSYQMSAVTMTPTASDNSAIIFRVAVSAVDSKFNGPVVLSVPGLPANAVEFSPATVIVNATNGAESKLKIKFPKQMLDSLPNSLTITVTGTSTGQSSNAQPVILTLK